MLFTNLFTKFHYATDTFHLYYCLFLTPCGKVDSYYIKSHKTGQISEKNVTTSWIFFSLKTFRLMYSLFYYLKTAVVMRITINWYSRFSPTNVCLFAMIANELLFSQDWGADLWWSGQLCAWGICRDNDVSGSTSSTLPHSLL